MRAHARSGSSATWMNRGAERAGAGPASLPSSRHASSYTGQSEASTGMNPSPSSRQRFRIDVDDIRAVNPDIVYARGSALGPRGEEADRGG